MYHSVEAEKGICGIIMLNNSLIPLVTIKLTADDFYMSETKQIFTTVVMLHSQQKPADIVTVNSVLHGSVSAVYISQLLDNNPISSNIGHYISIVLENSMKRQILKVLADTRSKVEAHSPDDVITFCMNAVNSIKSNSLSYEYDRVTKIDSALEWLQTIGEATGIYKTGLQCIDGWRGGLWRKSITMITAYSGQGKTSLAIDITRRVMPLDKKIIWWSAELSRDDFYLYLSENIAQTTRKRLVGALQSEDLYLHKSYERTKETMESLKNYKSLEVYDISDVESAEKLYSICEVKRPDFVFVDYIQKAFNKENETSALAQMFMRNFKKIMLMGASVILLSQESSMKFGKSDGVEFNHGHIGKTAFKDCDMNLVVNLKYLEGQNKILPYVETKIRAAKVRGGRVGEEHGYLYFPGGRFVDTFDDIPIKLRSGV